MLSLIAIRGTWGEIAGTLSGGDSVEKWFGGSGRVRRCTENSVRVARREKQHWLSIRREAGRWWQSCRRPDWVIYVAGGQRDGGACWAQVACLEFRMLCWAMHNLCWPSMELEVGLLVSQSDRLGLLTCFRVEKLWNISLVRLRDHFKLSFIMLVRYRDSVRFFTLNPSFMVKPNDEITFEWHASCFEYNYLSDA